MSLKECATRLAKLLKIEVGRMEDPEPYPPAINLKSA